MMHARAVPLFLAITAGCFPPGWSPTATMTPWEHDERALAGPYLTPVSPTVTALIIDVPSHTPPEVEWWFQGGPLAPRSSESWKQAAELPRNTGSFQRAGDLWVYLFEDLPTDLEVAYRITTTEGALGPYVFRTTPSRNHRERIAIYGDTRSGHAVHRQLSETIAASRPSLAIHTGDLVGSGGSEADWSTFFRIEDVLLPFCPVVACIGDHDLSARRYFERYWLTDAIRGGERYYVVDRPNLRIVVVDSKVEIRKGSDQYAFIDESLREGAERGLLMLVATHYPPYSSGAHGSHETTREVVSSLAARYGVELVVSGHDHHYERSKPIEGVTYIVMGAGGAPMRPVIPQWFMETARIEPSFLLVDIENDRMMGQTVALSGEGIDAFVVEATPPQVNGLARVVAP